ncbi:LysR substrate-binding domain-containing protein [Nitrospirillum amazonense]|uniref:LysR substrate-binding domain-containing protein n=1 Tax=Nitrospirillum amazonense TaxID=28077 RepID=UPI002DD44D0A|nr:LysR substrate-binding domain-containing protein [Nitrospirillum amazonense]MEC4589662.1 LysR substrate-binding domain-containing protein [Nitrospirillum amazonense]
MHFRQLEIYRAVMISGSASRAAELLRVTQPAVSRAVVELEESLGFSLFDRVKGRLVPTPEGQLFFRDVNASFVGLDRLRASAARIRDFGSGSLRIASMAAFGATVVPKAIHAFRQKHPQIAITLQVLSSSAVRDLVANQQFDIGIAADEVDLSGVEHRVFGSFRAMLAIPPGHPLAAKELVEPADLDGLPFIALAPEDRARHRITEILEAANVRPEIVVETPSAGTICALALAGVGVGLINPAAADGFAERGLIFRPFLPDVQFKSYLLFRPDAQKALLVKAFVAELLHFRKRVTASDP